MLLTNILAGRWNELINYINGSFVGGFVLIGVGGLSWCASVGAYDMFSYMFTKRGPNGYKPTLYDYSQAKREKCKQNKLSFLPYIVVGAVFVIISLILFIFM